MSQIINGTNSASTTFFAGLSTSLMIANQYIHVQLQESLVSTFRSQPHGDLFLHSAELRKTSSVRASIIPFYFTATIHINFNQTLLLCALKLSCQSCEVRHIWPLLNMSKPDQAILLHHLSLHHLSLNWTISIFSFIKFLLTFLFSPC